MGRRVLSMERDSIRRATIFALLFGGAIGVLAWLSGGFRAKAPGAADTAEEDAAHPGPVARVAPNLSLGESEDGTLRHDSVKVIGGKSVRFRAWTFGWKKSTPQKSQDPEVGVQEIEEPRIVLFPEPTSPAALPVAEGAAGTTRITSKTGVLQFQRDVRTSARLAGDVLLERFDDAGDDLKLRTQTLDCAMESLGDVERRRVQTADDVSIDGGRAHIEGTGLDADLTGTDSRITILSNVKGRFDASPGAFTGTGGAPGAKMRPVDVTCSGACELVSLDASARAEDRRWRATFRDKVHVVQGDDTLDCDVLVVDFRMGGPKVKGELPADRIVATGHVHAKGRTEARSFDIACEKATRTRQGIVGAETDVVLFEGSPVMNVFGSIAASKKNAAAPADAAAHERMEIRSDGPATMRTNRAGSQPTSPNRTNVVFEKNVIARQWDDDRIEAATSELRAPKVTLYGTRLADGKFQPDTLTSEGGVDLKRPDFTSHSDAATWARVPGIGINRYLLVGTAISKVTVNYDGVAPLRTFGKAKSPRRSRVLLSSEDNVKIDVYDERPDVPGTPPRPYALLSASPRVVMVQLDDGQEVSRVTADSVDATIGPGRQLQQVRASGGAHAWGLGADGRQRDVYGTRILLDQLVLPAGAPEGAPHPARLTALGEANVPAVAIVRESDGRRHSLRAERLTYDQDGSLLTATGHVVADISGRAKDDAPGARAPAIAAGAVKISAAEARIQLAPEGSSAAGPQLRKVTATGGVTIDGQTTRVIGRDATYDAVTGIAEVTGPNQTARVVSTAESERYTSSVNSDLIRVYFDTSLDEKRAGQLVRASCPGGGWIVRYFDPPDANGKRVPGSVPRRMRIESPGPIEVTRTEATATGDVAAAMFSLAPSGEWTIQQAIVYCDRARMTFDADAPGAGKDRMRTFEATGSNGRQVIVETPEYRARADRVFMDCTTNTMRLSTSSDTDVYVRELALNGRQSLYDSVTFNYVTNEWTESVRFRAAESAPPEKR